MSNVNNIVDISLLQSFCAAGKPMKKAQLYMNCVNECVISGEDEDLVTDVVCLPELHVHEGNRGYTKIFLNLNLLYIFVGVVNYLVSSLESTMGLETMEAFYRKVFFSFIITCFLRSLYCCGKKNYA